MPSFERSRHPLPVCGFPNGILAVCQILLGIAPPVFPAAVVGRLRRLCRIVAAALLVIKNARVDFLHEVGFAELVEGGGGLKPTAAR